MTSSEKPWNWGAYHQANQGRALRPFYVEVMGLLEQEGIRPSHAMELGCGTGEETLDLLKRGWSVLAIDQAEAAIQDLAARVLPADRSRAEFRASKFENLTHLEPVYLLYSFQSLSFCPPPEFPAFWARVLSWVEPDGYFAGTLFGLNDEWVPGGKVSAISEKELRDSLKGFEILHWREFDKLGPTSLQGEKHWHYFEVVARRLT